MNAYIYDIETYKYLFCVVFKNIETNDVKIFEISYRKNEIEELLNFLRHDVDKLIGFNNINFDYPVLHWLIKFYKKQKKLINIGDKTEFSNLIHIKATSIINEEFSSVKKKDVLIPQVDLFKIHHFDNKAKRTSLKALEIAMKDVDVRDLPYPIDAKLTEEMMDEIISYCQNDVEATMRFYNKSSKEIKLREDLTKEYGIDLINANDPKIGEEILLHFLSKSMNIDKYELKKMRTKCSILRFRDYILPYINFENKKFQDLLIKFKNTVATQTKDAFKYSVYYKDIRFDYAQGGMHACIKPGVYEPKEGETMIDLDVKSFYPNVAISNDFKPAHLGIHFGVIYEKLFEKRKEYPKSDPRNYGLKIALNGAYGKSNDEYSFLYDPSFTMKITLNGQLLLTKLIENVGDNINCKIIQANTDGFTIICKKSDEETIDKICKEWEILTKLQLEKNIYKKMIIRDVNNYIAVPANEEKDIKYTGVFEIKKAWHKNHSMLIVPKAISNYYIHNIPIEQTLKDADDILDFTKRGRANKGSSLVKRTIKGFTITDLPLQKNNRYFISNEGEKIIKMMEPLDSRDKLLKDPTQTSIFDLLDDVKIYKPREIELEAGYNCLLLNRVTERDPKQYDLNYNYYINEIKKITNIIDNV